MNDAAALKKGAANDGQRQWTKAMIHVAIMKYFLALARMTCGAESFAMLWEGRGRRRRFERRIGVDIREPQLMEFRERKL